MDLQNQPATRADMQALKTDVQALKTDVQALKTDVQALKTEFKVDLGALEQRMDGRMEGRMDTLEHRLTDRFTEAIHDSETKLLQAFYSFAETNNKRFVQGDAATAMAVSRLTTLESRVLELEKRLNMLPS
jgi:hypothetical protein